MRRRSLAVLIALLVPVLGTFPALAAGGVAASPNHPERRWQVLETPHFLIHYYQGHERLANEVVRLAEASYSQVTSDLGARPKDKVPVILTDDSFWNGYAEPLKDRIVLDPLLAHTSSMGMRRFFTHEFTHIITFEAFNAGIPISKVYAAAGVPSWFMEGIAQYEAEYWYPSLDRMLRLHTLEHTILTPSQRQAFHMLGSQAGAAGYNEGFAICRYLFETYGHDKLARLLSALRGGGGSFAGACETVFGKSLPVLEAEWRQAMEERYRQQTAGRAADVPKSTVVVPYKAEEAQFRPQLSPDGALLAYLSSRGRSGYVNLRGFLMGRLPLFVTPNGKDKPIRIADRVMAHAWSSDGAAIATVAWDDDAIGNPVTRLTITPIGRKDWGTPKQSLNTGKPVEFPRLDNVNDPAWSPDGKTIALVQTKAEHSDVILLDVATQKVVKTLTVSNDDRQYGELAWSPDGKWLAASTFYPGTGSKLMLISPTDGTTKSLTGGNVMVMDTRACWAKDSQSLIFTSDREGFTDLYRLQLGTDTVQRLSNTYTGAEEPALAPDGQSVLYVRHYNEGSEIRQVPLADIPVRVAMIPAGPGPAKLPPPAVRPGDVAVRTYSLGLSPDLVIPLTGRDEKGDQIGIGATFNDVLEKHALSAQLFYGLASNRFSYLVSYDNRMFDPLLRAVAFDSPTLAVSLDGKVPYLQRSQGGAILAARPLWDRQSLTVGLWGSYQRLVSELPDSIDRALILEGFNPHFSVGWQYNGVGGGTGADIHPSAGQSLEAPIDIGMPFLGGKFNYQLLSVEGASYFKMGQTDHVLALRAAGGLSLGQASPFLLGGGPITLAVGVQGLTPLRGYPIGSIIGNRLVEATAEYRIPILKELDLTLGAIYLDRVYGVLYTDVGNAWFDGQPWIPKVGVGGELRARMGMGGRGPFGISFGIGQGLINGPGTPQFYWYLGNVF
ncbi:MAG: PD40 domain-containing protein [Candidatus Sericytochromatia bacterium]|nr:PD40 domain-containing protein [Candidatus Sericytochromatia bacterium]